MEALSNKVRCSPRWVARELWLVPVQYPCQLLILVSSCYAALGVGIGGGFGHGMGTISSTLYRECFVEFCDHGRKLGWVSEDSRAKHVLLRPVMIAPNT